MPSVDPILPFNVDKERSQVKKFDGGVVYSRFYELLSAVDELPANADYGRMSAVRLISVYQDSKSKSLNREAFYYLYRKRV